MQNSHLRYQFYLLGQKSLIVAALLFGIATAASAQGSRKDRRTAQQSDNLPNYDNRWLHYGFSIGVHSSSYRVRYDNQFLAGGDSLHSIMPGNSFGFSLGLIANFRLADYLDVRVMPEVVFYEHALDYNYANRGRASVDQQLLESTYVEFPLLFKYKSVRRGNNRVYLIGGVEYGIEATGKKNRDDEEVRLPITGSNLSLQLGVGLDCYFPLFKFAPEVRFSRGLTNVLGDKQNRYSDPLNRVVTNTVTLYLLFE
jgi:hypothetical protein